MTETALQYFTHEIDGAVYGGWYRVIGANHIEVMSSGMLETAVYAGFSPESSAKSLLEGFVRKRALAGNPVPNLDHAHASQKSR